MSTAVSPYIKVALRSAHNAGAATEISYNYLIKSCVRERETEREGPEAYIYLHHYCILSEIVIKEEIPSNIPQKVLIPGKLVDVVSLQ